MKNKIILLITLIETAVMLGACSPAKGSNIDYDIITYTQTRGTNNKPMVKTLEDGSIKLISDKKQIEELDADLRKQLDWFGAPYALSYSSNGKTKECELGWAAIYQDTPKAREYIDALKEIVAENPPKVGCSQNMVVIFNGEDIEEFEFLDYKISGKSGEEKISFTKLGYVIEGNTANPVPGETTKEYNLLNCYFYSLGNGQKTATQRVNSDLLHIILK